MRRSIALLTSLALLYPVSSFAQNEATAELPATNGGTLTVAPVVIESPATEAAPIATEQPAAVQAEVPAVAVPPVPALPSVECMRLCSAATPYANCAALCVSPDYTPPAQQIVYQTPTRLMYEPHIPQPDRFRWVGMSFSFGAPSGIVLMVEVAPAVRWAHIGLGGGWAGLGGEIVGEVGFDPIPFVISPIADFVAGGGFPGKVPGVANMPDVRYTFEELMGGFALGRQNHARFFMEAGVGWMQSSVPGFQGWLSTQTNPPNGLTISDPNANIRLAPVGRLGFQIWF